MGGGWGWVIWGVGKGYRWGCRNFPRNFRKFSGEISGKFPVKCKVIRKREIEIANRKINIFTKDLQKNNPEIILSSPVEYLRNGKNHS